MEQLNQPFVIGALVVVIYTLVELLKHFNQRKNGINGHFNLKDRQMLHDLYVAHSRVDVDGIPLWYVPRQLLKEHAEGTAELRAIHDELKKVNEHFEQWECPFSGQQ